MIDFQEDVNFEEQPKQVNPLSDIGRSFVGGISFGQRALYPVAQKINPQLTKEEYSKYFPNMYYEPQTGLGNISKLAGEIAPWLLAPELKGASTFATGLKTGGAYGALGGGIGSLEEKGINPQENIGDIVRGGTTGAVLGGGLNWGVPMAVEFTRGLSKSLPEAGLSLIGIKPEAFEKAITSPIGQRLLKFPEAHGTESYLNKQSKKLIDSYNEYLSRASNTSKNLAMEAIGEAGELTSKTGKEFANELQQALERANITKNNQLTPVGKDISKLGKFKRDFDYYTANPTLDNLVKFRQKIDADYASWNKTTESPSSADKALINVAKDIRSKINESIEAISPKYRARDLEIAQRQQIIKNPDIKRLVKALEKQSIDETSTILKSISGGNKNAFKQLEQLSNLMKKEMVDINKPRTLEEALDAYRVSRDFDKTILNMFGVPQAIRRSVGLPLTKELFLPMAKNKLFQKVYGGLDIGTSKLRDIAKNPNLVKALIPNMMRESVEPLYGGVQMDVPYSNNNNEIDFIQDNGGM